jgi:acyl-coenzyme A synthetase/AMP-(fatty) acid ligase/threonine dehydrogenase-like Zn-dependent dehydrogenase
MTLVQMLEKQAREIPEQVAVISREGTLTYDRLNGVVNQMAGALLSQGLNPGDRVCFMLPRVPELVITFLAIAKARGVAVPLNFEDPGPLTQGLLRRLAPKFLVVHTSFLDLAVGALPPDSQTHLIVVGHPGAPPGHAWEQFLQGGSAANPGLPVTTAEVVYLNYTSGTTGKPKGALTTHSHIYWNTKAAVETLGLTREDVHLCLFAPFAHPHELFARPLYLGGAMVLVDSIRPRILAKNIMEHGVTCFMGLVPFFIMLMDMARSRIFDLSSLRIPESGGMHTPVDLIREFEQTIGVPILPVWGSTETTGIAIATSPGGKRAYGSVGQPCRSYEVKVVAEDGKELPPQEVGELVFRGPGVVSGYFESDANNQDAFRDGWYHSGDLARRDAEGNFYFIERKSGMLKVAGHRVFPLEIELTLLQHPAVKEAAIVGIKDPLRGEVPKAFVVLEESEKTDKKDLIQFCQANLAHYKVPKIIEYRDALPKIGSGKINKKSLREGGNMKALVADGEWQPRPGYPVSPLESQRRRALSGSQVWRRPSFAFKDIPFPQIADDEILIRVRAVGICGSDTHVYETDKDGYILFSGLVKFPCVLGHEFSGVVEKIGKLVRELEPGDLVAMESIQWCGYCTPCRSGAFNQCQNIELLGLSTQGALAEFAAVKAKYCWKLNGLRERYNEAEIFEIGALIEPIGCAYNGMFVNAGGLKPGETVVVHGAGPIGLAAVALARLSGASRIIAFDRLEARLELAKTLGADFVFTVGSEGNSIPASQQVLDLTGGVGADVQVEAAGDASSTIPEMERSTAPNGRIVYLGRAERSTPMSLDGLVSGAQKIVGSRGHSGYGIFHNIIRLIASGRLDPRPMITARFPFDEAQAALERSSARIDGKSLP